MGLSIDKIVLSGYKKFYDSFEYSFKSDLDIISKENEYGKTTILEAIVDAFTFNKELEHPKEFKGTPYIELEFKIDDHPEKIYFNGQSFRYKEDGEKERSKDYFSKKLTENGYKNFDFVLEKLLFMRERDLSINPSRDLKKLLDELFKTKNIEELRKAIGEILGDKKLFKGNFGKDYERLLEEKRESEERLLELKKKIKEEKELSDKLEKSKEELKKLEKEYENLNKKEDNLAKIIVIKAEKEVEALEQKEGDIEKEIKKIEEERDRINEEIRDSEAKIKEIRNKKNKASKLIRTIENRIDEYKRLIPKIRFLENIPKEILDNINTIESDIKTYKVYSKIKQKGKIDIISSKEPVYIEGRNLKTGNSYEYENYVEISYKDLKLGVSSISGKHLDKELKEKIEGYKNILKVNGILELSEKIDKINKLKVQLMNTKVKISSSLLEKRINIYTNRINMIKDVIEKLSQQEKDKQKNRLSKEMNKLKNRLEELRKRESEIQKRIGYLRFLLKSLGISKEKAEEVPYKEIKNYEDKNINYIEDELNRIKKEKNNIESNINNLRISIGGMEGELKNRVDPKEIENLKKELIKIEESLIRFERLRKILEASKYIISKYKQRVESEFQKKLSQKISEIFSKITNGAYKEVKIKENKNITVQNDIEDIIKVIRKDNKNFYPYELSDGTNTQLLLSIRLAFIEMFFEKPAFLLLDEPFAYFDETRTKNTLELLKQLFISKGWQVIITTAKNSLL